LRYALGLDRLQHLARVEAIHQRRFAASQKGADHAEGAGEMEGREGQQQTA